MAVELYLACDDCRCCVACELNARHELAADLCKRPRDPTFADAALSRLRGHPDFGPAHPATQAVRLFAAGHAGHRVGLRGDEEVSNWPWRRGDPTPLPGVRELLAGLGAKKAADRHRCARLLRYRGEASALAPLARVLSKDRSAKVRCEAARTIASLAASLALRGDALDPVRDALTEALAQPKAEVRAAACEALGWLAAGCPDDPGRFDQALCPREAADRAALSAPLADAARRAEAAGETAPLAAALAALGHCRAQSAFDLALRALKHEDDAVRTAAQACLAGVAQGGGLDAAGRRRLAEAAEEEVRATPEATLQRLVAEDRWGEVLRAAGCADELATLHRQRGWFERALLRATCGDPEPGRWPLGPVSNERPVVRADLASPGEQRLPRPRAARPEDEAVRALAAARDGALAATSEKGEILLYGPALGSPRRLTHPAPDHRGPARVEALAFAPDGALLASGDRQGEVRLWDARSGEPAGGFATNAPVSAIRWLPDGTSLLLAGPSSLAVWSRAGKRLLRVPPEHPGAVRVARPDPSGRLVATAGNLRRGRDPEVHLLDARSGASVRTLCAERGVLDLAFSPSGERVALLDEGRALSVFEVTTGARLPTTLRAESGRAPFAFAGEDALWLGGRRLRRCALSGEVETELRARADALAPGPDPFRCLCAGDDGSLHLVAADEARPLRHDAQPGKACVAWRGEFLAAAFDARGRAPSPALLFAASGERRGTLAGALRPKALDLSPDERSLALLCEAGVRLFDLASAELRWEVAGNCHDTASVAFLGAELVIHCDKADAVGGSRPGWLVFRDTETGSERRRWGGWLLDGAVDLSPDGRLAACGGGPLGSSRDLQQRAHGAVRLWELERGREIAVLADSPRRERATGEKSRFVRAVAFHPHAPLLAAAQEGGVTLWDLEAGAPRWRHPPGPPGRDGLHLAFSADGGHLFVGRANDSVSVLDAASGEELWTRSQPGELRHPRDALPCPLPDGRLAVGRRTVELVDLAANLADAACAPARRPVPALALSAARADSEALAAHDGWVLALTARADGSAWASAGSEGEVRVGFANGRKRVFTKLHGPGASALAFADDGLLLSGGRDGRLLLLDPERGKVVRELTRQDAWVEAILPLPGARALTAACNEQLVLWDLTRGEPLRATHACPAALDPSRRLVVGGARAGVRPPAFADGKQPLPWLLPGSGPPVVSWFSAGTLTRRGEVALPASREGAPAQRALAVLADGVRFALARTGDLVVASLAGDPPRVLAHGNFVSVAAHPGALLLAAGDAQGRVRLFDPAGNELLLAEHEGAAGALCFAPGGRSLFSGGDDGRVLRHPLPASAPAPPGGRA